MARRGNADGRADGDAASGDGADSGGAPIAVRLDDLLANRGMTLTELAGRVGVTIVHLSILKNGRAPAVPLPTPARLRQGLRWPPRGPLTHPPDGPPRA